MIGWINSRKIDYENLMKKTFSEIFFNKYFQYFTNFKVFLKNAREYPVWNGLTLFCVHRLAPDLTQEPIYINNPLSSEGDVYSPINQSVRYVHSCPQLANLIKMSTNNPSQKSVLEFFTTRLGLAEDLRTTEADR